MATQVRVRLFHRHKQPQNQQEVVIMDDLGDGEIWVFLI